MPENANNHTQLEAGIAWLKTNRLSIIQAMVTAIESQKIGYYINCLPPVIERLAFQELDIFIDRLQSNHFNSEKVRANVVERLQSGMGLTDIIQSTECMMKALMSKMEDELASQPLVMIDLLTRTRYITRLVKATTASVVVNYDAGAYNLTSQPQEWLTS